MSEEVVEIDAMDVVEWDRDRHTPRASDQKVAELVKQTAPVVPAAPPAVHARTTTRPRAAVEPARTTTATIKRAAPAVTTPAPSKVIARLASQAEDDIDDAWDAAPKMPISKMPVLPDDDLAVPVEPPKPALKVDGTGVQKPIRPDAAKEPRGTYEPPNEFTVREPSVIIDLNAKAPAAASRTATSEMKPLMHTSERNASVSGAFDMSGFAGPRDSASTTSKVAEAAQDFEVKTAPALPSPKRPDGTKPRVADGTAAMKSSPASKNVVARAPSPSPATEAPKRKTAPIVIPAKLASVDETKPRTRTMQAPVIARAPAVARTKSAPAVKPPVEAVPEPIYAKPAPAPLIDPAVPQPIAEFEWPAAEDERTDTRAPVFDEPVTVAKPAPQPARIAQPMPAAQPMPVEPMPIAQPVAAPTPIAQPMPVAPMPVQVVCEPPMPINAPVARISEPAAIAYPRVSQPVVETIATNPSLAALPRDSQPAMTEAPALAPRRSPNRRFALIGLAGAAALAGVLALALSGGSDKHDDAPAPAPVVAVVDTPKPAAPPAPPTPAVAPVETPVAAPVETPAPVAPKPVAKPAAKRVTTGKKPVVVDYDKAPTGPAKDPDGLAKARFAYTQGNQHLFSNELDAAIASYRQALADYPTYAAGYRGLGLAYAQKGDKVSAIKAFKTYLQLAPTAKDAAIVRKRMDRLVGR